MGVVRIGIIGLGGMGSSHARYLSAGDVADAQLAGITDLSEARRSWAASTYPDVPLFESVEAMLNSGGVDAVIIATPHYFHPPLAIQAMEAGRHVLIEKPAGVYTRQVREMNDVAANSDRVFGMMLNQRSRAVHQKLKQMIDSGEVGDIKRSVYIITDWFRAQSYYDSGGWRATWAGEGGGVLANQCPHNLDLWQWFCGMPKRIRAFCSFGKYHNIEVEDDVTAYAEYENGSTGVFLTSTGEAPGTNRLEIAADRGKIILENEQITFWRSEQPVSQFCREYPGGFGRPDMWKCEIPPGRDAGQEHVEITRNWVAAILEGIPLLAPGSDGINAVELFNAMLLSTWTDDWVDLPVDADVYYEQLQERIKSSKAKKIAGAKTLDVTGTF